MHTINNSYQEPSNTVEQLSKAINHELRTPLVAINTGISAAKHYLPLLTEAYSIARTNNLEVPFINHRHLEMLNRTLENVEKEASFASNYLNMLSITLQTTKNTKINVKQCSITECLRKAIIQYPRHSTIQSTILENILIPQESFIFLGDETLITTVLMNLIYNATHHIQNTGRGEIKITLQSSTHNNVLYFTNANNCIPADCIPQIFELGFLHHKSAIGCGLSFCREAIELMNGEIICYTENNHTHFKLSFPLEN